MNSTRLLQALDFAALKHRDQRRKSADEAPYINHPINVARLLAEVGGVEDEDVLVAAVLHDTLEDTETTRDELSTAFGPNVLRLVEEVTDDKKLPKAERKRLQVVHAAALSNGAALIKLADKIANIRDLGHSPPASWSLERLREYVMWGEAEVSNLPTVNAALLAKFEETVRNVRNSLSQS